MTKLYNCDIATTTTTTTTATTTTTLDMQRLQMKINQIYKYTIYTICTFIQVILVYIVFVAYLTFCFTFMWYFLLLYIYIVYSILPFMTSLLLHSFTIKMLNSIWYSFLVRCMSCRSLQYISISANVSQIVQQGWSCKDV